MNNRSGRVASGLPSPDADYGMRGNALGLCVVVARPEQCAVMNETQNMLKQY